MLTGIVEFRGILKTVPVSSSLPHRGRRAAPEQGPPLDGATGVLVQVDGILQEDGN